MMDSRRWFQVHLSTIAICILVASWLVWLNLYWFKSGYLGPIFGFPFEAGSFDAATKEPYSVSWGSNSYIFLHTPKGRLVASVWYLSLDLSLNGGTLLLIGVLLEFLTCRNKTMKMT